MSVRDQDYRLQTVTLNDDQPSKQLPVSHPWVFVDLDGTLMEDGYYPDFGPPIPGAKAAMDVLKSKGLKIAIFTARTSPTGFDGKYLNVNKAIGRIYAWCARYDIPIDYVWPLPKPTYVVAFFDDRAIHVNSANNGRAWEVALNEFFTRFGGAVAGDWQKAVLPPKRGEVAGT